MTVKFTNNASTTIGTGINASATSLTVASASSFPQLSGADDYCYLTLQGATNTTREVVKATALSSNTFTIVRAQDNTSAGTWAAGDIVELRMTAALLTDVIDAATVEGVKTNYQYTPTAGQTVFSGADNASATMIINQAALVSVYMNGVRLVQGTDYSVSSANNTVTLGVGATTADIIDIEVYGNFVGQSGAAVGITGGSITGTAITATTLGATGTATLNTLVSNNATISGGSLDGVTIGGTTRGAISGNAISGTSFASTGNMTFGDNDKAIFGASSDLQIYHDGSHSRLVDSGTGNFIIQAAEFRVNTSDDSEAMLKADVDGAVTLFHNGSTKLATTSSGIDVTGTVTADGGDFSGLVQFNGAAGIQLDNAAQVHSWTLDDNFTSRLNIGTSSASAAWKIGSNNNAYLTVSPTGIDVTGTVTADGANIDGAVTTGDLTIDNDDTPTLNFKKAVSADILGTINVTTDAGSGGKMVFQTKRNGDTALDRMTINDDGNVGIGVAPNTRFQVSSATTTKSVVETTGASSDALIEFTKGQGSGNTWSMGIDHSNSSAFSLAYLSNGSPSLTTHGVLTVDTSGNFLVGTTSAFGTTGTTINQAGLIYSSADGDRSGQFDRTGVSDGEIVRFTRTGTTVGSIGNNTDFYIASQDGVGLRFTSTQVLPCSESGAIQNGSRDLGSSSGRFKDLHLSTNIHQGATTPSSSAAGVLSEAIGRVTYSRGSGTGGFGHVTFINGNGTVGSITTASSATAYNTSSDYRLKENVVAMSGATERLKQLKPSRFNFIADADTTVDGFLAHEVQDIVPEAITGTKDAMMDEEYEVTPAVLDDDGNVVTEAVMGTRSVPDYQGIDQSKLVPLLVATIQELEARIAALES